MNVESSVKYTPLYGVHVALGAQMITTSAGYRMPAHYGAPAEEHKAVRERVGMSDHSLMTRFDVKGRGAFEFLQRLAANDASKLAKGQLMYTTLCNEQGNIMDDLTIWRFDERHFRIVSSSIMRSKTMRWLANHLEGRNDVYITDVSSSFGMITVQGPRSRETLQRIADSNLDEIKFFHFAQTNLKGIPAIVARVGFTGELGFECYFAAEDTVDAWNAIGEAGKEFGIRPYGFDTLDSLRYEKGYIFYGYEVTDDNNPFECGLERWISFDKGDFIGRDALIKIREKGVEKKLVGIDVESDLIVSEKQPVKVEGRVVGETVAGFKGLTIGKNIAWAWMGSVFTKEQMHVAIEDKGSQKKGSVVNLRYYDPTNKRMRI